MEPTSLEMRLQYESQAEDVEHVELVDDLLVRFHREPEQPLRMPACPHLPMHAHNIPKWVRTELLGEATASYRLRVHVRRHEFTPGAMWSISQYKVNLARAHNRTAGLDAQCKVKVDSANSIESTCNAPKTAGHLRRGALRTQAGRQLSSPTSQSPPCCTASTTWRTWRPYMA
jgi:hypothetical protein